MMMMKRMMQRLINEEKKRREGGLGERCSLCNSCTNFLASNDDDPSLTMVIIAMKLSMQKFSSSIFLHKSSDEEEIK